MAGSFSRDKGLTVKNNRSIHSGSDCRSISQMMRECEKDRKATENHRLLSKVFEAIGFKGKIKSINEKKSGIVVTVVKLENSNQRRLLN